MAYINEKNFFIMLERSYSLPFFEDVLFNLFDLFGLFDFIDILPDLFYIFNLRDNVKDFNFPLCYLFFLQFYGELRGKGAFANDF